MKKLFLAILGIVCMNVVFAQQEVSKGKSKKEVRADRISAMSKLEEEGVIKYKKHNVFGVKLSSDGYGGFVEMARARSVRTAMLYQVEIAERKHVKEEKQQGPFSTTSPLIFGKINFFYPVKLGVQYQYLLGNKGNKNGISITGNLGGGVVLGLLRPYLMDVDKQGQRSFVGYQGADSSYYLNGPYYGGPNLGTGWSKLKLTPGIYIKPSVRFDYGKYNEMVSAVEVGLNAEFYTKKIPQMIYTDPKQLFFSAYVALVFGRRK